MAQDMMLYWGSGSPPCWRVQLVLEEKGLQGYKEKLLSFGNKEHKSEEVLQLNPRGQLPTFRHGDIVINESMAICHYLNDVFGEQGTTLIPKGAAEKALVIQRMYEAQNLVTNGTEGIVYYIWRTKKEDQKEEVMEEKKAKFREELDRWQGYLEKTKSEGGYLCGQFSMADVMFYPPLAFQVRVGLKLANKWPAIQAYYNLMSERQSVKATWPPHWKEPATSELLADI